MSHFKDLKDPRQQGKITYPLDEVLLLCLLAVLAGAETIVDIAWFGGKKLALLRRFRRFRDGTPAHDQLGEEPWPAANPHDLGVRGTPAPRARAGQGGGKVE